MNNLEYLGSPDEAELDTNTWVEVPFDELENGKFYIERREGMLAKVRINKENPWVEAKSYSVYNFDKEPLEWRNKDKQDNLNAYSEEIDETEGARYYKKAIQIAGRRRKTKNSKKSKKSRKSIRRSRRR